MKKPIFVAGLCSLVWSMDLLAQSDTTKFPWPDPSFNTSKPINGTFSEYRNTLSANHFHSGVDIGEPDGNPIYPCLSGIVHSLSATSGSNNFIRIRTQIGSEWKHISYVHINPNPGLSVGDAVIAGSTILGTIINGLGHVHLTERELTDIDGIGAVEINALRAGGGLTPYDDPYSPVIDRANILFRETSTGSFMPPSTLFGKVEIIARINERNGPGDPGTTQTNNGTYRAGFRLRAADTVAIVYEPPDDGLRFRFDRKPLDAYADSVFLPPPYSSTSAHYYRLTSGSGAASVSSTRMAPTGYIDVSLLPEGDYVLELFTDDTRGNTDVAWIPVSVTHDDLIPPSRPTLLSTLVDSNGALTVRWVANAEPDLQGYRLYYRKGTTWVLAASESTLTAGLSSLTFSSPPPFLQASDSVNRFALVLAAVDTASEPNESPLSDVYYSGYPWFTHAAPPSVNLRTGMPLLIVDAFDRFGGSGSWAEPTHSFAETLGSHLPLLMPISTCSNEEIASGAVNLNQFRSVYWISGDESTADHTLTSGEQQYVKSFLETGGNLFISGSEIGWDLGRSHPLTEPGDFSFYQDYLKSVWIYDGNSSMSPARGVGSTLFSGLSASFGQVYPEDYPDDIEPAGGSHAVMTYNAMRDGTTPRVAGIAYNGIFGMGIVPGKLVYLGFPYESMGSSVQRQDLMDRVSAMFEIPTNVERLQTGVPSLFSLSQNFPNPFNPSTTFSLHIPAKTKITLQVYDILGRQIATLVDDVRDPGTYVVTWNATPYPSGTYFAIAQTESSREVRKLLLIK